MLYVALLPALATRPICPDHKGAINTGKWPLLMLVYCRPLQQEYSLRLIKPQLRCTNVTSEHIFPIPDMLKKQDSATRATS